jgi:transcriptional regulator with XRE-family HTH domain
MEAKKTDERKVIGDRIKSLLQEHGKKVKELARYIGLQPSSVSMIVSGDMALQPTPGRKVAEFFNISMDKLYDPEPDLVVFLRAKPGNNREEVRRLDRAFSSSRTHLRDKAIYYLLLDSGLRPGELLGHRPGSKMLSVYVNLRSPRKIIALFLLFPRKTLDTIAMS